MRTAPPRPPRGRESGFSLLIALAVALLLATLAMTTALRMQDLARDGNRDRAHIAAFYAAEGGLAAARAALAQDTAWKGGRIAVDRGAAVVTVAADLSDTSLRRVVVLGEEPGPGEGAVAARVRVEAVLRLRERALPAILSWSGGGR